VQKEAAYLESTPSGNIITGFDNYMKGISGAAAQRRKTGPMDQNRVFSRSSISYRPNTVRTKKEGKRKDARKQKTNMELLTGLVNSGINTCIPRSHTYGVRKGLCDTDVRIGDKELEEEEAKGSAGERGKRNRCSDDKEAHEYGSEKVKSRMRIISQQKTRPKCAMAGHDTSS
jgi:hypothetical protein